MGEKSHGNLAKLRDFKCPICLYVLIEPVTLPCNHELCLSCFESNVFQTSLTCPLCRKRISSWARKQSAKKSLINQDRWLQIQSLFPEQVKNRQNGLDDTIDDDDTDDVVSVQARTLAKPGELRKEYEEEAKKISDERERLRAAEEEKSAEIIKQLQEEEINAREAARLAEEAASIALIKQLQQEEEEERRKETEKSDEIFARFLSEQEEISTYSPKEVDPVSSPLQSTASSVRRKSKSRQQTFMDKFVGRVAAFNDGSVSNSSASSNFHKKSIVNDKPIFQNNIDLTDIEADIGNECETISIVSGSSSTDSDHIILSEDTMGHSSTKYKSLFSNSNRRLSGEKYKPIDIYDLENDSEIDDIDVNINDDYSALNNLTGSVDQSSCSTISRSTNNTNSLKRHGADLNILTPPKKFK